MSSGEVPVLVVTGPTGAGKSTLCGWLAERGAWWIDADAVGHEMLDREEIRSRVVEAFSTAILDADGGVERRLLAQVVFGEAEALARLNAIVHPPLVAEIHRRIDVLRRSRAAELIVVDAALHFQFEPSLPADLVVGVSAERELRLGRIRDRDALDDESARRRIEGQSAVEASLGRADEVLDSSVPRSELRRQLFDLVDRRLGTAFGEREARMAAPRPQQGPLEGPGEEES